MEKPPSIGVLVVSYRNNPELLAFLRHLDGFPAAEINCTVATANGLDPAETSALLAGAAGLMPGRLHFRAGAQNPGYFGGAALGLQELRARGPLPEWTLVTNDDIRFAPDFFSRLAVRASAGVAVLAPDIVVPATGLHQNPLYVAKPPARRVRMIRWLHQHPAIMRLFVLLREGRQRLRRRRAVTAAPAPQAVYAPHGACLVFSRRYFEAGGSLDYPCFLYGEEFFVAETARRIGLEVRVEPALRVTHHEHSATGLLSPSSMAGYVHESLGFLLREYYSTD